MDNIISIINTAEIEIKKLLLEPLSLKRNGISNLLNLLSVILQANNVHLSIYGDNEYRYKDITRSKVLVLFEHECEKHNYIVHVNYKNKLIWRKGGINKQQSTIDVLKNIKVNMNYSNWDADILKALFEMV